MDLRIIVHKNAEFIAIDEEEVVLVKMDEDENLPGTKSTGR